LLVLAAGAVAFLWPRPTSACIDLKGDAAWFFRSCQAVDPYSAASWQVDLDPGRKSLSLQVENAYPGYQLECDLHFANNGRMPFKVNGIQILNGNPEDLVLSAVLAPGGEGKTIKPCGYTPRWGRKPGTVPLACRSNIHLSMAVGEQAEESADLPFTVQVLLQEK
jgi:hypothetical protein